ncbi:M14 family zinc carboxypeptidase [Salegentibacter chungangensis]|uniref:M14 family zinc carboxypeptidase n=1 Tax=Salegentibacter chungangensis TaxID=1335724 RepID=A0ABW3NPY9_9FLAO
MSLFDQYESLKDDRLLGRYISYKHLEPLLEDLKKHTEVSRIGESVLGKPIHLIKIGSGKIKLLAWSQMHGNESTTTKAVFDVLNAFIRLKGKEEFVDEILRQCSIHIIPMLNPDGAEGYTRVNANQVDLNRDAAEMKEPETRVLRAEFDEFKPDFCLNLHDQRTIFNVGNTPKPATLSFLTPSRDRERTVTADRLKSMQVVSVINKDLQGVLDGMIGRYDDAFNINCTGDTFQSQGVPTILFEAGHYPEDYEREITRKYVFMALFSALNAVSAGSYKKENGESYFSIPENGKLFNDVILREAALENGVFDVALQFKEVLKEDKVDFVPIVEKIELKIEKFGHREIVCGKKKISLPDEKRLTENVVVNKIVLNDTILGVKSE